MGVQALRDIRSPPVVVRIVPRLAETRSLRLTRASGIRLARALEEGGSLEGPISAEWVGDPALVEGDFPSWSARAPVLSARLARELAPELRASGELVPVVIDGTAGDYVLCHVSRVVDCLDEKKSSRPGGPTRHLRNIHFDPARLPADVPGFRVPESPFAVFWNRWFFDALVARGARCVDSIVVWSMDDAWAPFPDPMR